MMVKVLKRPGLWLYLWGGLGALLVLYVIIAASVKPDGKKASGFQQDKALLVGEMADFSYAIPPRGAPIAEFQHGDEAMSIADFRGKVVLVNFWATWCAPCLKELPSLDALQGDLGGEEFEVVAIAADPKGPEVAQRFLDKLGAKHLELYADPRLIVASTIGSGSVLPVSILYDRKGNEIGRLIGEADWTSREARRLIERAIAAG